MRDIPLSDQYSEESAAPEPISESDKRKTQSMREHRFDDAIDDLSFPLFDFNI